MAYYPDLSDYLYSKDRMAGRTKHIDWLTVRHPFETKVHDEKTLDRVWQFCKISFEQMRGLHECDICPPSDVAGAERNEEMLLIGAAEIRVFAHNGIIFAAPTMIYHYMSVHHYAPPQAFMDALLATKIPHDEKYFAVAEAIGLEYRPTSERLGRKIDPARWAEYRETLPDNIDKRNTWKKSKIVQETIALSLTKPEAAVDYFISLIGKELQSGHLELWQIVLVGRVIGLSDARLNDFVKKCLLLIFQNGAVPVFGITSHRGIHWTYRNYGATQTQWAENIVTEWVASGRDPETGGVKMALPQSIPLKGLPDDLIF